MFHFDLMNCSLVSTLYVCVHKSLELSNSFITLNNVLTQPLLITKQMAAHNPFFFFFFNNRTTSVVLTGGQGNDRMTFTETPLNETMNTILIQMVGRAVAHCWQKAITMVFL